MFAAVLTRRSGTRLVAALVAAACLSASLTSVASAQTARTFIYQGKLTAAGSPVSGAVTVGWAIFAAPTGGVALASGTLNTTATPDGLFTMNIPLGAAGLSQFLGAERHLELTITGESGVPQVLSPRQALRPTPYALHALNSPFTYDGALAATFSPENAKISIGTTSALFPLTINSLRTTGDLFQLRDRNSPRWNVSFDSSTLRFANSQSPLKGVFIRDAGYVGIGVTDPDVALHVRGSSSSDSRIRVSSDGTRVFTIGAAGEVNVTSSDMNLTVDAGRVFRFDNGQTDTTQVIVDGRVTTNTLQINGGSDIAEPYNVTPLDGEAVKPGMVVSIDEKSVGTLKVSTIAYDRAVAGIVSGANGIKPGLTLTQTGTVADGEHPIANVGRVWCYVDADAGGAITAGDLLTTSATPGHAMRADAGRGNGAILGKAMSSLDKGKGMVLVLVGLQ